MNVRASAYLFVYTARIYSSVSSSIYFFNFFFHTSPAPSNHIITVGMYTYARSIIQTARVWRDYVIILYDLRRKNVMSTGKNLHWLYAYYYSSASVQRQYAKNANANCIDRILKGSIRHCLKVSDFYPNPALFRRQQYKTLHTI